MGQSQVKGADDGESYPILLPDMTSDTKKEENDYPIHKAAYLGDVEKLKDLLSSVIPNSDSLARRLDSIKSTPLHQAAQGANQRSVAVATLLLKVDEEDDSSNNRNERTLLVNFQDAQEKTALHYAVRNKQPGLVALLLSHGADPNLKDVDGCTPLHIAAEGNSENAVKCAEILLSSDGIRPYEPAGPNRNNQNVLHIAANAKAPDMLKFLINKGFNHSATDSRGFTPLHIAAGAGDSENAVKCVLNLLKVSNADEVNAKSDERKQTALHIASFKSHQHIVEVLLADRNVDILATDSEKRTSLHWATDAWFRPTAFNCVKLLVESEKISSWHLKAIFLYDLRDSKKETALQIACKHHSLKIAELLITAHPTPEAWLKDNMLRMIYHQLPEAMVPLMNKSLTYNPAIFHERNEAIDAEFGTITGYSDPIGDKPQQETKYIKQILSAPKEIQTKVLLHPLVQMFLDLKWEKIKWITWAAIGFQFLWLMLYTILIFEVYAPNCSADGESGNVTVATNGTDKNSKTLRILLSFGFSKNDSSIEDCSFNEGAAKALTAVLYLLCIAIVVKEFFQMNVTANYIRDLANWGQWTLLIVFVVNSIPAFQTNPIVRPWQYYVAAFGIALAWLLCLREIGKFPRCGIYAAILKKVFWHCLKMLMFYFPLLVAFALCLRILVPGKGQYTYVLFAIVKVVIMMTGELDFEDAFYEDDGPHLALSAIFGQVVFLLLVFITTIVLLNLLTGLAVNDVQSLIEEAEVNRLSNELEQIYLLETLILWGRRHLWGSGRFTDFLQRLNVTSSEYDGYRFFATKLQNVETKTYPPKLRERIREFAVPNEEEE